jgi:hypothetical protein
MAHKSGRTAYPGKGTAAGKRHTKKTTAKQRRGKVKRKT